MGIFGKAGGLCSDGRRDGVAPRSSDDWLALPSRRRSSLRRRFVVAITVLVAIELAALTLVLGLSSQQELRREIETGARNYAALAVGPLCEAYETYYASGHSKFRQLVGDIAERNPDLQSLEIYDTGGHLLFSTQEFDSSVFTPNLEPGPASEDTQLLEAVRGLESVYWLPESVDENFTTVEPYIEEWGRHRYSVVFRISYDSLGTATRQLAGRLLLPTVGSLILGVLLAFLLARQSLEPLEKLIAGARDLGRGRLDRRIEIDTDDEFEDLALTFNLMATHLASSIVELEGSNLTLQRTNVELKELDQFKSDLLANVSHELRTPLTSVKGYTEAMSDELLGPINSGQREGLVVVRRNIDRLLQMISGLLTYSRLESQRVVLDRGRLDLGELADEAVGAILASHGAGANLGVVSDGGPLWVDADGVRIGQVLENLLTNAVKFTPDGGRVELRLQGEPEMVRVEVADEGIGIDPSETSRVFDRFYQVESTSTRRYGGIGIGLAIVKQILDAHGCGIEVESELGRGTVFRFRLPRPTAVLESEAALTRVLIVDPEAAFARELTIEMEAKGWGWRVVPSAEAARRLVGLERPDAVVLDRLLPDGDGFELLEEWRLDPVLVSLPVVVVSGRRDQGVAERLGATAFLQKPIVAREVIEELFVHLDPQEGRLAMIVAPAIDSAVREISQGLRAAGFRCRRPRSKVAIDEMIGEEDATVLFLLDGRKGPHESWNELLPAIVKTSAPLLMLTGGDSSGALEYVRSYRFSEVHEVTSAGEVPRLASQFF